MKSPVILLCMLILPRVMTAGELKFKLHEIDRPGGGSDSFYVAAGVLKVERNRVTLLTEYAGDGPPEQIPAEAIVFADDSEG